MTEPFDHLPITVEVRVGSREMAVEEILQLEPGSILQLDRAAGGALDLWVGNVLLASAEPMVVDDRLAVRITDLL